ncbi:MAG: phosphatidate cytidylyltransferase [Phycisphaeraceae bacterium]|nr:phosphatidate cytidylyltransferase [Phycisphaeraceae bacterium]
MDEAIKYLFSTRGALSHPVTQFTIAFTAAALVLAPATTLVLERMGRLTDVMRRDIMSRYYTWLLLIPLMIGPILWCPLAAMVMVCAASFLCYREYARATGLFRFHAMSGMVGLGIILVFLTSVDHWYRLFLALAPLMCTVFAAGGVIPDEPKGYIQRVALAAVGFLLLGSGLGHLGYMANDRNYRPIMCMLILCVHLSDLAGFIFGRAFGRRKLFPNTSPRKTLEGHIGALLVTAPVAAYLGHLVFPETRLDTPARLALLGLIIAVGSQVGDLVLGSIKRDIGIKDIGATFPGSGGFLDRFTSLMVVAPAAFHYINILDPFGADRAGRLFTLP